jgi:hypothetical protein
LSARQERRSITTCIWSLKLSRMFLKKKLVLISNWSTSQYGRDLFEKNQNIDNIVPPHAIYNLRTWTTFAAGQLLIFQSRVGLVLYIQCINDAMRRHKKRQFALPDGAARFSVRATNTLDGTYPSDERLAPLRCRGLDCILQQTSELARIPREHLRVESYFRQREYVIPQRSCI